ncbi:MAG: phospholipid carrier-dependent glycosyltransferase [Solirubrobacteraceae bacterium]|nr:phospholipid carrier-dependent glycosyltransferase [Solirubrobacteraceae bacterium]
MVDPETIERAADAPEADLDEIQAAPGADAPKSEQKKPWWNAFSRVPIEVWLLGILASITRFAQLGSPKAIVFDEIYFREYSLHYHVGTYYFDLHPPLGKLLIGLWGAIAGVDVDPMGKDPATALRFLPALAGVGLILVIYLMIRQLSGSRRVATLGAGLLLLDNAILAESRFTLIDSMLLFFGISAVTLSLAARRRSGKNYWYWLAAAAALGGMSSTVKLTGLTALGLVGLIWLADVVHQRRNWKPVLGQLAVLAVVPAVIYLSTFAVHFALLQRTGPGDAYMSTQFQATLKGNANYSPEAKRSFFGKFHDLNSAMHGYELSLNSSTHPYQSKWYSWPYMKRGVYQYVAPNGDGKNSYIYTLGNPFVWWGTLLGFVIVIGGWFARPARFKPVKWPLILLGTAYLASYLPFSLIVRPMFLYHYFFPLIFSLSFVVIGLGALTGWINDGDRPFTKFSSRNSQIGYWAVLGVAFAFFLYFAPITYGFPLTDSGLEHRMWLHSWR